MKSHRSYPWVVANVTSAGATTVTLSEHAQREHCPQFYHSDQWFSAFLTLLPFNTDPRPYNYFVGT